MAAPKFAVPLDRGALPLRPIRWAGSELHPASEAPDRAQAAAILRLRAAAAAATASKPCPPLRSSRDAARRALLEQLDAIRGRKALVLEASFAAPLGLVADALALKEHGVEV